MRATKALELTTLIVLLALPLPSLSQSGESMDPYNEGLKAYKSGRYRDALELFDKAKFQFGERDHNFAIVHYNLGRCVEKIMKQAPDEKLSCQGIQWFKAYLKLTRSERGSKNRERAKVGLNELRQFCPAQDMSAGSWHSDVARASVGQRPSVVGSNSPLPAILTGLSAVLVVSGIGLQLQYMSVLNDRDAAFANFRAEEDLDTRDGYEVEVRELEIEAASLGAASWSLIGAGTAVGIVAIIGWLNDNDDEAQSQAPTLGDTPGTLSWSW